MAPRWLKITGLLLSILLVVNTHLLLRGVSMLTRLESDLDNHSTKLASMEAPVSGELSENLEFLNTRVHLLTRFITDLEVKLTSLKGLAEAINRGEPPHTAGAAEKEVLAVTGSSDDTATQSTAAAIVDTGLPTDDQIAHDDTKQPAPAGKNIGSAQVLAEINDQRPWVINVASLDNQAAADEFSSKAQAHGVPVQHQVVTVKGKQRWRIQVTGFSSLTEARINAGPIKEKLGLETVWISQR
jgi:hypothetical protein